MESISFCISAMRSLTACFDRPPAEGASGASAQYPAAGESRSPARTAVKITSRAILMYVVASSRRRTRRETRSRLVKELR